MRNFLAQSSEALLRLRRPAAFALVAAGFGAGIAQVLLFRELLVVCQGNEVSLGVMLAGWLLYGALGSSLVRRLARADVDFRRTASRAACLLPLSVPALTASMVLLRAAPLWLARVADFIVHIVGVGSVRGAHLRTLLTLQHGEMLGLIHIVAVVLVAMALPATLAGAQFGANCHLLVRLRRGEAGAIGSAYALDAIGHLGGGVLLGWVILQWLDPFRTAAASGVVGLVGAAWLVLALRPTRSRAAVARIIGLAVAGQVLLVGVSYRLDPYTLSRYRWHEATLLASANSVYGNVAILRQGADGAALFENGTPSGESPPTPQVQIATQFVLLQHPQPQYVLMIGGGAFGGLREVLKYNPARVDYVELDPLIFRLARDCVTPEDAAALSDPRVNCIADDGRLWVKRLTSAGLRTYDVVIVSVSEPMTAQLNRFYTEDFYREVKAVLRPGGVLGFQMPSSSFYIGPQLLKLDACIWRTAGAVFPMLALTTGESVCVAASADRPFLLTDARRMYARLRWRPVDVPVFAAQVPDLLDPANVQHTRDQILGAPRVPLNTDTHPIAYLYDQAVWAAKFHAGSGGLFDRLERLSYNRLNKGLIYLGLVLCALGLARPVRAAFTPLAVFVSGFVGMLLELVLLTAFQSQFGAVYSQVGVITGAFMVGLAGGGLWAGHYLQSMRRPTSAAWLLAGAQAALSIVALLLPAIVGGIWHGSGVSGVGATAARVLYPALTALVGVGVGAQFPLASWTAAWGKWSIARAATALYALDLIGAAVGASIAGTILLPALGVPNSCYLAAWISLVAAALLALRARKFPN